IMLDAFHAPRVIKELKSIGVQISLDDFGTGFNSLHYLQELPIDLIKIDQSFVRNCSTDLNNENIVKSTIEMAHRLKMGVIAE
ncbi:EAL domain-containing protein, partial [Alkalibacillus haloalkaliphilus]|uniref:EAL domain-containing protein n=1 Tax=Alkalibacillus haloalkaliphilus TaxID=94136 RepID=UPI002935CB4C